MMPVAWRACLDCGWVFRVNGRYCPKCRSVELTNRISTTGVVVLELGERRVEKSVRDIHALPSGRVHLGAPGRKGT